MTVTVTAVTTVTAAYNGYYTLSIQISFKIALNPGPIDRVFDNEKLQYLSTLFSFTQLFSFSVFSKIKLGYSIPFNPLFEFRLIVQQRRWI